MFLRQEKSKTASINEVKNLSVFLKIKGILNLLSALTLLYAAVRLIFSGYNILTRFNYEDDFNVKITILILMSIGILISFAIHIIVSFKNFKSFITDVFLNPINIIQKYKEFSTNKIIKRLILIIIGTVLLSRYMAVNILPFIFSIIISRYISNNLQTFNKIEKSIKKSKIKNT